MLSAESGIDSVCRSENFEPAFDQELLWITRVTVRRECLDFLIPLNERHLRRMQREWVGHYNAGRPHSSLGPGIPDRCGVEQIRKPTRPISTKLTVVARPVLGGLHHEYASKRIAA